MKGVVVGASQEAVYAIETARNQGIYVIALDGNPKAAGLRFADESIVVDISDITATSQIIEKIKPDFLIPAPIGRYLTTAGYINEHYHLPGIKYKAVESSVDKYLFHQILCHAGLRNIEAVLLEKAIDIDTLQVGYPAVLKPQFGSGSREVFYLSHKDQLETVWGNIDFSQESFVLEEAVKGTEYGVDGAVIKGELSLVLLRKKQITPPPARQVYSYTSICQTGIQGKLYDRVGKFLRKVIEILDYDNCLFHADLIIKENEIFVIEISPRPSGHSLHSVFVPMVTGINMIEEYLHFLKGETYHFKSSVAKCMRIRYFDFEEVMIKKVPEIMVLQNNKNCHLALWNCNITPGSFLHKVTDGHSIMGRGYFIVEGEDEQDLEQQCEWVLNQFEGDVK